MRFVLIGVLVAMPVLAAAQSSTGLPPDIVRPKAAGKHVCPSEYPPAALRQHHEGWVGVTLNIEADGTVSNVEAAKSSGYPEIDAAVVSCVSDFKYQPATRNGVAIRVPWSLAIGICLDAACRQNGISPPETTFVEPSVPGSPANK